MTLLHPPTSPNVLPLPRPTYSAAFVAPSLGSSLVAIVVASVIEIAGLFAMLATLTMVWVGLLVIVVFRVRSKSSFYHSLP